MGCCSSDQQVAQPNVVLPNKVPIVQKRQFNGVQLFLFGVTSENMPICVLFDPLTLKITRLEVPKDYVPTNYSTMNRVSKTQFIITGGVNFNVTQISSKAYLYKADTNEIKQLPELHQQRYTHFSIVYGGYLYLFGGRTYGNDTDAILTHCQRLKIANNYDKAEWQQLQRMPTPRCTGLAVIYRDSIYIFGGYQGQMTRPRNIERFNPKDKKWEKVDILLNVGVQSPIIAPYKPNEFIILGGQNNVGPSAKAITINLKDHTIRANLKLSKPKVLAKCCRHKKDVFIIGGIQESIQIEKYNLQSEKSQVLGKIQLKNIDSSFKVSDLDHLSYSEESLTIEFSQENEDIMKASKEDDIVYVFGTREEPFILEFNISIPDVQYYGIPSSIQMNCCQGGVNLEKRKFLIFGGIEDSYTQVSKNTYFYDHQTRKAERWQDMIMPRYAFSWRKMGDFVYAIGGGTTAQSTQNQLIFVKQCERLNIKSRKWENVAKLAEGVISPMSLEYNNSLYVFGGILNNKSRNNTICKYLQQQNKWLPLNFKLNFGIQAGAIFQNSQKQFYIFGGRLENGDSDGIWSLTFTDQKDDNCVFQQKGRMTQPKSLHTIYGPKNQNFLIVFGGKKQVVSCYQRDTLQSLKNKDHLRGMEQKLKQGLSKINQDSMRNFSIVLKNS